MAKLDHPIFGAFNPGETRKVMFNPLLCDLPRAPRRQGRFDVAQTSTASTIWLRRQLVPESGSSSAWINQETGKSSSVSASTIGNLRRPRRSGRPSVARSAY